MTAHNIVFAGATYSLGASILEQLHPAEHTMNAVVRSTMESQERDLEKNA